jgi:Bacterial RNA polymerase, alpha chain C terminal domain
MNNQFQAFQTALYNQIQAQGMTFDPSIDCRNDLVNHYGYTVDQVSKMHDHEVFSILDEIEDKESGFYEIENPLVNIPCSNCNHPQTHQTDYSDWNDCYTLKCPECSHEGEIHYTGYDTILESYEEYIEDMKQPTSVKVVEAVKEDTRTIDDLDLSVRTYNCMYRANYKTVKQIKELTFNDLCKVRNLGRRSIEELQEVLNVTFK